MCDLALFKVSVTKRQIMCKNKFATLSGMCRAIVFLGSNSLSFQSRHSPKLKKKVSGDTLKVTGLVSV